MRYRAQRRPTDVQITVETGGDLVPLTLRDVSVGGMEVTCPGLTLGQELHFAIQRHPVKAEVVRVKDDQAGVVFRPNLRPDQVAMLVNPMLGGPNAVTAGIHGQRFREM